MDNVISFATGAVIASLIWIAALGPHVDNESALRQQAIEADAAEWRINRKTGEREFVFTGRLDSETE